MCSGLASSSLQTTSHKLNSLVSFAFLEDGKVTVKVADGFNAVVVQSLDACLLLKHGLLKISI